MNKICIVGLGYVGLPLLHRLSFKNKVYGYDIDENRISQLKQSVDLTNELTIIQLRDLIVNKVELTNSLPSEKIDFFIVTVPTPVDRFKVPDLTFLINASIEIGKIISKGAIVIYESTVFPGTTEDILAPIIEINSGLRFNKDFFCGYSPERINPGDKEHTIDSIIKVTSGSTIDSAKKIDSLYKNSIKAGTFLAESIKVAEAAKVIENTQRDINIAFINELTQLFDKMEINIFSVLDAAKTKWNFLDFKPGLVGGHCIGVDPYYLAYKSKEFGHNPELILAGRQINDSMPAFYANKIIKSLLGQENNTKVFKILILGITFKENCPDIRNSKVIDLIKELELYKCEINIVDDLADKVLVKKETNYDLKSINEVKLNDYNKIVLAVAHNYFNYDTLRGHNVFDLKGVLK